MLQLRAHFTQQAMWLASKTYWGIVVGIEMSFDLTTTFDVPSLSHNMDVGQNMAIGWIRRVVNVSTENNGIWYIDLTTPNKLVGALGPRIKIGTLFDTFFGNQHPHKIRNGICQHKWL